MLSRMVSFLIKKPFLILLFWVLSIAMLGVLAINIGDNLSGDLSPPDDSQATQVQEVIKDEFEGLDTEQIIITVSSEEYKIGDLDFELEVTDLITEIKNHDQVQQIQTYNDEMFNELGQVGDSDGVIIVGLKTLDLEESQQVVREIREQITDLNPSLETNVTGLAAIANDLSSESEKDVGRSAKTALPFTLVLLIVAFGSIIAAFIPPLIGWISLVITLGLLTLISDFYSIHALAQPVVAMLGLAAGIDYTLLMVSRFREEMNLGKTIDESIVETVKNAGKTVLFSGFIVVLSLTALLFPSLNIINSIGLAGIIVIIIAMMTATTLVPALLKVFGKRIVKSKKTEKTKINPYNSLWTSWGKFVVKQKRILGVLAFLFLLILAIPIFSMNIHNDGVDNLADPIESKKGATILDEKGLAGTLDRIDVLVETDNPISEEIYLLTEALEKLDVELVLSPTPTEMTYEEIDLLYKANPDAYPAKQLINNNVDQVLLRIIPKEKLDASTNDDFINKIRDTVENNMPDAEASFGGDPIAFNEFDEALFKSFPLAIAFVLLVTFILLALVFRSMYMAFVAVLSNVLVLGASFGLLVYYFQDHLEMASLHPMVPIIVFAIIFGLSMDYQVFLLSRIKEERFKGATVDKSIVNGMTFTSRIITYAGLIMFVVFFAFIFSDVMTVKMLGFGLAVAIILDITIARLILMPALLSFEKDKKS